MPAQLDHTDSGQAACATLIARVRRVSGTDHLSGVMDDLFRSEKVRLDDQTRAAALEAVAVCVETIERELRGRITVSGPCDSVRLLKRLVNTGVLHDAEFAGEIVGRAQLDRLARVLSRETNGGPSLLARLTGSPDEKLASAASAVLAAANRRRQAGAYDLGTALYTRMVWWVAAALRCERATDAATEGAIIEAARETVAAYVEADRVEVAAMRLAQVIDGTGDELAALLVEAIGDGQLVLFTGLLAHAAALGFEDARSLVVDRDADGLCVALRAAGLQARDIARIVLALGSGGPIGSRNALADIIEGTGRISPDAARDALAPTRAGARYRAAVSALSSRPG